MSVDPSRARRYFKQHFGMTFHAFGRARRLGGALAQVRAGADATRAGLEHGFDSTSGFRDAFARLFGAPPGRFSPSRRGRDAEDKAHASGCLLVRWLDTPLGAMLAGASERGLCLLEFLDRRALEAQVIALRKRFACPIVPGSNPHLDLAANELNAYFEGSLTRFSVPLDLRGTEFQVAAWKRLTEIPHGATLSYSAMARDISREGAQRAVGKANGDNPVAIIVPCHRVVRSDGTLCGYGGGVSRKKWLLEHERAHLFRRSPGSSRCIIPAGGA